MICLLTYHFIWLEEQKNSFKKNVTDMMLVTFFYFLVASSKANKAIFCLSFKRT